MQKTLLMPFENLQDEYLWTKSFREEIQMEFGNYKIFATEGFFDIASDEVEFWRKIKNNSDFEYKIFSFDSFMRKIVFKSQKFEKMWNSTLGENEMKCSSSNGLYTSYFREQKVTKRIVLKIMRIINNLKRREDECAACEVINKSFARYTDIYKEFNYLIMNFLDENACNEVNNFFSMSSTEKKIVRFYLKNRDFEIFDEESLEVLGADLRRKQTFFMENCDLIKIKETILLIREIWTENIL